MRKIPWFIATFSLLVSCSVFAQKAPPKQPRDESEDEIVAAVVRYATLAQKGIIFLTVNGHDPSPETLRMLSVWYVRVLPASRAVYVPVPNEVGTWKDKRTGELGSYFEAGVGKRISDTRVEVSAGWWQPCGTYTVIFQHGARSVENYKAWEICF
jgi:hypothetical protein